MKINDSPSLRPPQSARRAFLSFLALIVGIGAVALVALLRDDSATRTEHAPTIALLPSIDHRSDAAWAALTPAQQRSLMPFKAKWATMSGDEQQRWLRTADRFQAMSPQKQRRLHTRMEQWARMTPQQQAQARMRYRAAASQLSTRQKQDRWEAYQKVRSENRTRTLAASSLKPKAPASVQVEPGATTVLMTQLFGSEFIAQGAAQPQDDAPVADAETRLQPPAGDVEEASDSSPPGASSSVLPAPSVQP